MTSGKLLLAPAPRFTLSRLWELCRKWNPLKMGIPFTAFILTGWRLTANHRLPTGCPEQSSNLLLVFASTGILGPAGRMTLFFCPTTLTESCDSPPRLSPVGR
jgi:hypothetical protein